MKKKPSMFTGETDTAAIQSQIQTEERYRRALEVGKMAYWEFDLLSKQIFWSDELFILFGLEPHAIEPNVAIYLSFIHPDDREKIDGAFKNTFEGIKIDPFVFRIVLKDNSVKFLKSFGDAIRDGQGVTIKYTGLLVDVTSECLTEDNNKLKAKLLNTIGQAVIATDLHGIVTYWNKAAEQMYGWTAEETLAKSLGDFLLVSQTEEQAAEILNQLFLGETWAGEFVVRHKDGRLLPVYVTDSPIFDQLNKVVGIIGVSSDITARKKNEEALIASNEELRILSGYLQNVREEERKRIAREIHDELGQQLTAIKMDVSWLNEHRDLTSPEKERKILDLFQLIDNSIRTVRKIASDLRPAILDDLGLIEAIKWQIEEFTNHTEIPVTFTTNIDDEKFSPDITTAVFRIFQETLNNIAKHAKATSVTCVLQKPDGHLLLIIEDNGIGFNLYQKNNKGSLGLMGIKERIHLLKGKFVISSKLKTGTAISVSLPLI